MGKRTGMHNPLRGRIDRTTLVKAAQEIKRHADLNTRMREVDGEAPSYSGKQEVGCIEERLSNGAWRLYTVAEPVPGHGVVDVKRDLRENLLPALKVEYIRKLCRGGAFNDWTPAMRWVCDGLDFRVIETFAGKVQA